MHIPVGKPIKMVINAQDVIHDVGLPQFQNENGCCARYTYYAVVYPKYTMQKNEEAHR